MIISHDFGIGLKEYTTKGTENEFPVFDRCPSCSCVAQKHLHRNGYYWRYGINEEESLLLPICRFRCLGCGVNISILPDFLIPYFQYTLQTIVERLFLFLDEKKIKGSRQLLAQHLQRLCKGLHWVHSCFIDMGERLGFKGVGKKEALKYVKMIRTFGVVPFFRRSWGHLSSYFMGKLILPYFREQKNNRHPT